MSDIRQHKRWNNIVHWPTTLGMLCRPFALCGGSLGRRCRRRRRTRCAINCLQTSIWKTWTRTCSLTSIGSSPNTTSSGRVTCTNVSSSWKTDGHFQESSYVKKAKVNKINREKQTFLHHLGSRPFSYRMEARRKGSKFPEIDVFADVYVRPGDELTESLHVTMVEKSQSVLQKSTS